MEPDSERSPPHRHGSEPCVQIRRGNNGPDPSWALCREETEEQRGLLLCLLPPHNVFSFSSSSLCKTPAPALLSHTALRRALGALLALLLLDPVHVEGFVLERSGEQSAVRRRSGLRRLRLDGLAKSRVGGGDEVRVVLSRSVHDLMGKQSGRVVIKRSDGRFTDASSPQLAAVLLLSVSWRCFWYHSRPILAVLFLNTIELVVFIK